MLLSTLWPESLRPPKGTEEIPFLVAVHPDKTCVDFAREPVGSCEIRRPHPRSETERCGVSQPDGVSVISETGDCEDRSENFFDEQAVLGLNIGEHDRIQVRPRTCSFLQRTVGERCAFCVSSSRVFEDVRAMRPTRDGPDVGIGIERVTDSAALDFRNHLGDELIRDRFLDQQASTCSAHLSGVEGNCPRHGARCNGEVRSIGEYQLWALAAEFEMNGFRIRLTRVDQQLFADIR